MVPGHEAVDVEVRATGLSVSIFMTPAATTLPTFGVVEVKLAPEATAIMAASIRMKRAPTTLRGEACHRAETRFMLCSVPFEQWGDT